MQRHTHKYELEVPLEPLKVSAHFSTCDHSTFITGALTLTLELFGYFNPLQGRFSLTLLLRNIVGQIITS